MSNIETVETPQQPEPLHEIAERAVGLFVANRGPLTLSQVDQLMEALTALPDEELGDALFSLQRVAGYFHQRLEAPGLAAQLIDLCYDMTLRLAEAADRIGRRRLEEARERKEASQRMTGAELSSRAPREGVKPDLSVSMLRPRTKFR